MVDYLKWKSIIKFQLEHRYCQIECCSDWKSWEMMSYVEMKGGWRGCLFCYKEVF